MDNCENLKLTCLHDLHLALGARMSPFAGYDMPIEYGLGIIGEHNAVRNACGVFDVSHMGEIGITARTPSSSSTGCSPTMSPTPPTGSASTG